MSEWVEGRSLKGGKVQGWGGGTWNLLFQSNCLPAGKPKGGRASNPYSLKEEESAVPPPLASKLRSVGGSVDSAKR